MRTVIRWGFGSYAVGVVNPTDRDLERLVEMGYEPSPRADGYQICRAFRLSDALEIARSLTMSNQVDP